MTMLSTTADGPPLDPSSPEARQWVLDELAKGHFSTEPSPFERLIEWLLRLLSQTPGGGFLPGWAVALVVVAVLAVVTLVVLRLVRREPSPQQGRSHGRAVDEEGLAAADYRARARAAVPHADWDAVLLDSYRALAAAAVERTLLSDLPGRTAHEVALALAPVFPALADRLAESASEFDAVRYGRRHTTRAVATATAELDTTILATRPTLPQLVTP